MSRKGPTALKGSDGRTVVLEATWVLWATGIGCRSSRRVLETSRGWRLERTGLMVATARKRRSRAGALTPSRLSGNGVVSAGERKSASRFRLRTGRRAGVTRHSEAQAGKSRQRGVEWNRAPGKPVVTGSNLACRHLLFENQRKVSTNLGVHISSGKKQNRGNRFQRPELKSQSKSISIFVLA
jgi:hypothetical protein